MSLSGALSVALSGLQTSTAAVQVISGNVANAQTPGYTDKSISLAEVTNGSTLGGVQITNYNRVTNNVLSATLNSATTSASYLSTQNNYMTQVQSVLDSSNNPPALSSDLSNFQAAYTQYAASPSDTTLQQSVIAAGQSLANEINGIASQITTLQTNVENDLSTAVTGLNTDLTQVQTLNTEISTALANNQPIVNLEDQRDQAINQIAQYTNVTVLQRNNGQIALYTASGTPLLDGSADTFSVSTDGKSIVNSVGGDVSGVLTGGSLQAQTDFLSSSASTANGVGVINKMQSQLENFANMFVSTATGGFSNTYSGTTDPTQGFFTATIESNGLPDTTSFAVNANLVNGTSTLNNSTALAVSNTFNATNLAINVDNSSPPPVETTSSTFSANGLTTQNQTYSGIVTAILSGFQQAANAIKTASTTASTQKSYYQSSLSSDTGVNTDTELVNLTNWENSYAASAHVISTIQSMMITLEGIVG